MKKVEVEVKAKVEAPEFRSGLKPLTSNLRPLASNLKPPKPKP